MTVQALATDHYADRARLAAAATVVATQHWQDVDPDEVDVSWSQHLPELLVVLGGAQLAAAVPADAYTAAVLTEQGLSPIAEGPVRAAALSGVASDGRTLATLLYQPAVATMTALAAGTARDRALATGLATLQMIVGTQVADAGRVADQVAMVTRRSAGGYVRMVRGTSCPRCAILAGRWYRWSDGFRRHPRCDCIHIPGRESMADDLTTDPRRLIASGRVLGLSRRQRRAIDLGSDPAQVVNAQRGMYTAGGRAFTTESTGARGAAPHQVRLMPDQILREAADRDDAVRLLRLHHYLV